MYTDNIDSLLSMKAFLIRGKNSMTLFLPTQIESNGLLIPSIKLHNKLVNPDLYLLNESLTNGWGDLIVHDHKYFKAKTITANFDEDNKLYLDHQVEITKIILKNIGIDFTTKIYYEKTI